MKFLLVILYFVQISAFQLPLSYPSHILSPRRAEESTKNEEKEISPERSLEQKMSSWEATEEERKSTTLGGLIPGSSGADSFDIGLYVAFPFLFGSLFLFLVFPFLRDSLDVASLESPPTQ